MTSRVFTIVLAMVSLMVCIVAWDTIVVYRNRDYITESQAAQNQSLRDAMRSQARTEANLQLIRVLNYKVCVRINDTRGVLILQILHERKAHIASAPLIADLPLYACNPSYADGASILSPAKTRAYLALLAHGKKPGP